MASVTLDVYVATAQREFRFVMVEEHGLPEILVVAVLAFGAITPRVNILNAVTPNARRRNIGVSLPGMTCRASHLLVSAAQRKLGGVVIESFHVQPGIVAMALLAFLAELTFVRIGCLVTIKAKPGRVAKLDLLGVTIAASHRLVCALQAEVRQRVIERLSIELNDIDTPALVIGVAHPAFLSGRIELAPMKSASCPAVRGDILVALQTFAGLRLP